MTAGRMFAVSLLILGTSVLPQRAFADPVRITTGALVGDRVLFDFEATDGSRVTIDTRGGTVEGQYPSHSCDFCPPGEVLDLRLFRLGDMIGTIALDGRTFGLDASGGETGGSLNLDFQGSVVLPAFAGDTVTTVTAPFTFSGLILPQFVDSMIPPPVPLIGAGLASVQLQWEGGDFPNSWFFQNVRYDFQDAAAPVPEPASLLLLGSGVAALVTQRVRRNGRTRRIS